MAKDHATANFGTSLFRISFLLSLDFPCFFLFEKDRDLGPFPLVFVSAFAKNVPEVEIKLQRRKNKKIACAWPRRCLIPCGVFW
jgi:hypothetical protein